jgi:hypothetical protein
MAAKSYTADVVEEDGELMLVFPADMIAELGWSVGDTIVWEEGPNNSYLLVRRAKDDEQTES